MSPRQKQHDGVQLSFGDFPDANGSSSELIERTEQLYEIPAGSFPDKLTRVCVEKQGTGRVMFYGSAIHCQQDCSGAQWPQKIVSLFEGFTTRAFGLLFDTMRLHDSDRLFTAVFVAPFEACQLLVDSNRYCAIYSGGGGQIAWLRKDGGRLVLQSFDGTFLPHECFRLIQTITAGSFEVDTGDKIEISKVQYEDYCLKPRGNGTATVKKVRFSDLSGVLS